MPTPCRLRTTFCFMIEEIMLSSKAWLRSFVVVVRFRMVLMRFSFHKFLTATTMSFSSAVKSRTEQCRWTWRIYSAPPSCHAGSRDLNARSVAQNRQLPSPGIPNTAKSNTCCPTRMCALTGAMWTRRIAASNSRV